jgi:hypothetical protein
MAVNCAAAGMCVCVYVCPCFIVIPSPDGYRISHATSRDERHVPLQVLNKHRMINKAVEGKLKRNPFSHFDVQAWNSGGTTE